MNDTYNLDKRELTETELDAVSGGMLYLGATNPKQETDAELTKAIGLIAGTIANNLTCIMQYAALFLHVRRADACRHSVWRDRCEATRDAARSGLICHVGGSAGHTAPRPMGRTA